MAGPAGDYHRGEMDIHEQRDTFHAFLGLTKWGSLAMAVTLVFLVLTFATKAGWLAGVVSAAVILAIGIFALRSKPGDAGH
ncbi:MAG TPA: aa3-type cytochrome c oxidase subunit IV [Caulobacteraceae bacterium]|nr:aa3-type cytochrome c oxidase subunit IV [Caulobacteraceae bacterium]